MAYGRGNNRIYDRAIEATGNPGFDPNRVLAEMAENIKDIRKDSVVYKTLERRTGFVNGGATPIAFPTNSQIINTGTNVVDYIVLQCLTGDNATENFIELVWGEDVNTTQLAMARVSDALRQPTIIPWNRTPFIGFIRGLVSSNEDAQYSFMLIGG